MIERMQYDTTLDSQRFGALIAQGASEAFIEQEKAYTWIQIKTDIAERLDQEKHPHTYEIRGDKLFSPQMLEPFEDVIRRGVTHRENAERENAELTSFMLMQAYMSDSNTPDGAMTFNPSLPDGGSYKKNYLDVYKKIGNTVHYTRYLSDRTNQEYREKILQINPGYSEVIPQDPKDIDFFLNPVIVPRHMVSNPDDMALFILESKKGTPQEMVEGYLTEAAPIWISYVNYAATHPDDLIGLEQRHKAGLAATRKAADGGYKPTYNFPKMEIQYLSEQKETLGGGGCGGGACSVYDPEIPKSKLDNIDGQGPLSFRCPDCKKINTRSPFQLITNCAHCESDKVLPSSVKIS